MNRRHRNLVTLPDGRFWDEAVMRDYIGALERRAIRPTVARLSAVDPMCVAVEADSRKRARE